MHKVSTFKRKCYGIFSSMKFYGASFVFLSRLIEKTMLPAYKLVCQTQLSTAGTSSASGADSNPGSSNRSFINLPKELFEMLASAGPYLYRDALLLQKVCRPDPGIFRNYGLPFYFLKLLSWSRMQITRVLRGYYLCALELVNDGDAAFNSHSATTRIQNPRLHLKDARLRIDEALGMCLLPSLQLIPANPAVGQEIWELLSLLPYEVFELTVENIFCVSVFHFEISSA